MPSGGQPAPSLPASVGRWLGPPLAQAFQDCPRHAKCRLMLLQQEFSLGGTRHLSVEPDLVHHDGEVDQRPSGQRPSCIPKTAPRPG